VTVLRSGVANGIVAGLALALSLLVGETVARVFRPLPFSTSEVWTGFDDQLRERFFVPDPKLGYRPGPGWTTAQGRFGFRNGAEYDGGGEPTLDVAVLGDSLIQDGELGAALRTQLAPAGARIWVAGIGGYNTLQEAGYLERWIERVPDVLVLAFCLNDFARSMVVVPTRGAGRFVTPDFEPLGAVNPFLFRHSALYRLVQAALMSRRTRAQYSIEGIRRGRDGVRRGLVQMRGYARRHGIPFLVLLYPHLDVPESPWEQEAHRQARSLLLDLAIPFVDLGPAYAARGPVALRRRPDDDVHPRQEGHDIAARELLAAFPDAFARPGLNARAAAPTPAPSPGATPSARP
jgi:lysophospholipase L1-like esterase